MNEAWRGEMVPIQCARQKTPRGYPDKELHSGIYERGYRRADNINGKRHTERSILIKAGRNAYRLRHKLRPHTDSFKIKNRFGNYYAFKREVD